MVHGGDTQHVLEQWFPTLGNPRILGLQLSETLAFGGGQGFLREEAFGGGFSELQSNNFWVAQGWESLL